MMAARLQLAGGGELSCQTGQHASNSLGDWLDSQCAVMTIWLDRLIAEGDPDDVISLLHRHAAWLDLMRGQIR